ncbi:hypothetical protein [Vibrio agarivorans]|uniref:hypothetical protein n=1 Tax=Vibrio agarivorans TaxID=153622 RepID=UPI0022306D97|nr:hypothetical protein [Vibrio agarivorans]MDN3660376.1 hypothetical protein [Vibrio agarivorans]
MAGSNKAQGIKERVVSYLTEEQRWFKVIKDEDEIVIRHSPSSTTTISSDGKITTEVQGQQTLNFDDYGMWLYWMDI